LEWLRLFWNRTPLAHVIYYVKVEMPTSPKLKAVMKELHGKNWANVEMGKLLKKPRSVTRRNKAPRSRSRSRSRSGPPLRNRASLSANRAGHDRKKKDPYVLAANYENFLTCLLVKFNLLEKPANKHEHLLEGEDCANTLKNAGNFKDKDTGSFTKTSMLSGFKTEFSGKKYKEFKKLLNDKKAENTLDDDLKDLLSELNRVEGMMS
jgi:hypothetical protein